VLFAYYLNHADDLAVEGGGIVRGHVQDLVGDLQSLLEVLRLLQLGQLDVHGRSVRWSLENTDSLDNEESDGRRVLVDDLVLDQAQTSEQAVIELKSFMKDFPSIP